MKRVAGHRRHLPDRCGEFPYMRHYAPNDGTVTPEAMRLMGQTLSAQTGRVWAIARENDLYLRMYMLPIRAPHG